MNIHLWSKIKVLIDHFSPITDNNINEKLNLFSTSSIDGYTNIYTLPRSKLFMSIKLKQADPIDNVSLCFQSGVLKCVSSPSMCYLLLSSKTLLYL